MSRIDGDPTRSASWRPDEAGRDGRRNLGGHEDGLRHDERDAAPRHGRDDGGVSAAGFAVALGAGAAILTASLMAQRRGRQRRRAEDYPDSAPEHARRAPARGGATLTANAVTINRPRHQLFAFWRDFGNLAQFMQNVEEVRPTGDNRWVWRIAAPAGRSVRLETEVVDEREGERIAWRSLPGSDVEAEGEVAFRDAPAGRGTIVEASVAYRPPGGEIGRLIATLFQREPQIQGRRELKRFKMLMETGEIATSANRRSEQREG